MEHIHFHFFSNNSADLPPFFSAPSLPLTPQVMDKQGAARDMFTLASSGVHASEGEVPSIAAMLSPSVVSERASCDTLFVC
jgi:hypothetical protein